MAVRRWSRRAFLGASAVVAGAIALPVGRARAAVPSALSRAGRVFLDRGLFVGALVTAGRPPSEKEWRASGCNTATVDGSPDPPIYAGQWAIANYRQGKLRPDARLFTVCFGNEEPYDERVVARLAEWFALMHAHRPDVLVHSNHIAGQWSVEELRSYVRTAKPDLLTFSLPRIRSTNTYNALATYRKVALEGHDGSGNSPIAFGHYGAGCTNPARSEAELRLDCFAGWTMGAHWINLFRWNDTAAARFARIARESRRLSPFLVRLTSTDVRVVPGGYSGDRPRQVPVWDSFASPYIDNISGSEIVIGCFRPIVDLDGRLAGKYGKAFMLLNGDIDAAAQFISVSLKRLGSPNRLLRVNRGTGRLERIPVRRTGSTDEFTVSIEGGAADLFFLTTGPTYDQPPAITAAADRPTIQPGDEFTVTVIARNDTVDQPMPDVQARLLAPPGWSTEPDGSIRIGDLTPGTPGATSWRLSVPTNADAGDFTLTVEITYQYAPNTDVRGGMRAHMTMPIPYNSLSDDFSNIAITDDSAPNVGNIDGDGNSYSALALSVAGLTPGSPVAAAGISFSWPEFATGGPDNVVAAGQAFRVDESGAKLGFLGCCTYGPAGGTGRIVYSDGSEQPYLLSYPDWYGTPPRGTNVAAQMAYRNSRAGEDGNRVNVYVATVDIDPTKTVDAVILPNVGTGVTSGSPAMHIFAIALA